MRFLPAHSSSVFRDPLPGPVWIAAGLTILICGEWWPLMPITTGLAFIAMGSTGALINQLRGSTKLLATVAAHIIVYVSLFLLFVGAISHAAMSGPQDGLSFFQGLDFGVGAGLMVLSTRMSLEAMAWDADSPVR